MTAPAPLTDWHPFCPGCGFVERIDDDGTCSCGADTCGLDQIRERLAERGLHVVSAADRAVLDAMAAVPRETLERALANTLHGPEHSRDVAAAELARRDGAPHAR